MAEMDGVHEYAPALFLGRDDNKKKLRAEDIGLENFESFGH